MNKNELREMIIEILTDNKEMTATEIQFEVIKRSGELVTFQKVNGNIKWLYDKISKKEIKSGVKEIPIQPFLDSQIISEWSSSPYYSNHDKFVKLVLEAISENKDYVIVNTYKTVFYLI